MSYTDLPHHHTHEENIEKIEEQLRDTEKYTTVAEIFKQLSDPTRIRIFWLLCHCEECVLDIAAMMEMSSPAISYHLRPLKSAGLIISRRVGKEVYYKAADNEQSNLLHEMIEQVMTIACPN